MICALLTLVFHFTITGCPHLRVPTPQPRYRVE